MCRRRLFSVVSKTAFFIDPPYNTGNEGWVYNDNVNDPKIKKWLGEVVGKEGEDLTRHDKWLCMMYPRLKLLQKLLADDGVIFISIDEIEHRYLELVMDEIFGSANRIDTFVWQNNYGGGAKSNYVVHLHEYVLCFAKEHLDSKEKSNFRQMITFSNIINTRTEV